MLCCDERRDVHDGDGCQLVVQLEHCRHLGGLERMAMAVPDSMEVVASNQVTASRLVVVCMAAIVGIDCWGRTAVVTFDIFSVRYLLINYILIS